MINFMVELFEFIGLSFVIMFLISLIISVTDNCITVIYSGIKKRELMNELQDNCKKISKDLNINYNDDNKDTK